MPLKCERHENYRRLSVSLPLIRRIVRYTSLSPLHRSADNASERLRTPIHAVSLLCRARESYTRRAMLSPLRAREFLSVRCLCAYITVPYGAERWAVYRCASARRRREPADSRIERSDTYILFHLPTI